MILKEVLEKTTQFFKDKKFSTPRLDAELLLAEALSFKRIDLYINFERPMSDDDLEKCRDLVRRRSGGEPVAYILGRKEFFNLSFSVGPGVLIPRPETEHVVEAVLNLTKPDQNFTLLDLGAGSGCIPISILANRKQAKAVAVEKSLDALAYLKKNVEFNGLGERLQVSPGDAREFKSDINFDFVSANPPYIAESDSEVDSNVRKFEPGMALFSEGNGLKDIASWERQAEKNLKPGGFMVFEFGSAQGKEVEAIFVGTESYSTVRIAKDLAGLDRIVIAQKKV